MAAKFIAMGANYHAGKITIPHTGFETRDQKIIDFSPCCHGYNNFFFEVDDTAKLRDAEIARAKRVLAEAGIDEPQPVEPIVLPDMEEEQEALKAEEEAKAKDIAELEAIREEKKAKREAYEAKHPVKKGAKK